MIGAGRRRRWAARRVQVALDDLTAARGRDYLLTIGFTAPAVTDRTGLPDDEVRAGLDHLRRRGVIELVDEDVGLWALHTQAGDRRAA